MVGSCNHCFNLSSFHSISFMSHGVFHDEWCTDEAEGKRLCLELPSKADVFLPKVCLVRFQNSSRKVFRLRLSKSEKRKKRLWWQHPNLANATWDASWEKETKKKICSGQWLLRLGMHLMTIAACMCRRLFIQTHQVTSCWGRLFCCSGPSLLRFVCASQVVVITMSPCDEKQANRALPPFSAFRRGEGKLTYLHMTDMSSKCECHKLLRSLLLFAVKQ